MEIKQRIIGFDFARGLAIIGMIFVNFKMVMTNDTNGWLYKMIDAVTGKAAALFVVLAGVGMTMMYNRAKQENNTQKIKEVKNRLFKRAAFLFVTGLSYYFIWPADILHFYGLYLFFGVFSLSVSRRWLVLFSLFVIIAYTLLALVFDYDKGWDWEQMEYLGFFSLNGFFRNLFFNGFHPVFPWIVFLMTGIWLGRINLKDKQERKKVMIVSIAVFVFFKGVSAWLVGMFSALPHSEVPEIEYVLGTAPMPPLFFYMITASALAVFIIVLSVCITQKFSDTLFIQQMVSTGQLALSNYIFHVVIGMFGIQLVFGTVEQAFSIEFAAAYACVFSILVVVSSHYWLIRFKKGPLETVMRRITG